MEQLFVMFSLLLTLSAIMAITSSNPIHSVVWLVGVFLFSAGMLITLKFEFLSLMIIIIYVGAITILFLFVIMMLDILQLRKITSINNIIPIIFIVGVNIIIEAWWFFNYNYFFNYKNIYVNWELEELNHISSLGCSLYSEYSYLLIIISLLLIIAMIGAIVLTLESNINTKKQYISNQYQRNNSWI